MNYSIGVIGQPYYDEKNDRTKAFLVTPHNSKEEVVSSLNKILNLAKGSRISARLFVLRYCDAEVISMQYHNQRMSCEAIIPFDDNYNLVYYGWNDVNRQTSYETRCKESRLLNDAVGAKGSSHNYSGVTIEVSGAKWNGREVAGLEEIYKQAYSTYLVDLNQATIEEMLKSSLVAMAKVNNQVASVAMAEVADINFNGQVYQIAEISEVATHPSYQRKGLSQLVVGSLIKELECGGVHFIFSEVRSISYGMIKVVHSCGLRCCGRLDQHCLISSAFSDLRQESRYGDLAVFVK